MRGQIRGSVSAAEIPVPGAEKVWCKELHPEAVAVAASPGAGAKDAIRFAQTKPFELQRPFGRSITQVRNADAAGKPTLDGSLDQARRDKCH